MIKWFKIWGRNTQEEIVDERAVERYIEIARIKTKIADLRRELEAPNNVRANKTKSKAEEEKKEETIQDSPSQQRESEINDIKAKLLGKK